MTVGVEGVTLSSGMYSKLTDSLLSIVSMRESDEVLEKSLNLAPMLSLMDPGA